MTTTTTRYRAHGHRHDRIAHHARGTARRNSPVIIYLFTLVAARGVLAFTGTHPKQRYLLSLSPHGSQSHFSRTSPPSFLQLSTKEDEIPLSFEATEQPLFEATEQPIGDPLLKAVVSGVTILLLLSSATTLPSTVITTYSSILVEYPLPTKSLTSGVLCGISDSIAQFRDSTRKEFNYGRLIRFAGKGCFGGIIWSLWYDNLDSFLDLESDVNIYKLPGVTNFISGTTYEWIRDHTAIATTTLSLLIEQFLWCPIVFGTFEIPVSTLLNGGSIFTVKKEVDSKLNGLLISNAKVWTLANVVIYNAPVVWRPAISNCVDLVWQGIVSDVAADCGTTDDDICEIIDETDKDFTFFAKKSRF